MMKKYSRNKHIIDSEIDDQQVMMQLEKSKYYGLNPVGKHIWDLLAESKSLDEIVGDLLSVYKVNNEQCEKEVKEFLDRSVQCEIIEMNEAH